MIVPYERGVALLIDLCGERARQDPHYLRTLLQEARSYTVSLYRYQVDRLATEQGLFPLQGGAIGLNGHYNKKTGLFIDDPDLNFLGVI